MRKWILIPMRSFFLLHDSLNKTQPLQMSDFFRLVSQETFEQFTTGSKALGLEQRWHVTHCAFLNRAFSRKHGRQSRKLLYFEWSPPWHFKTATLDFYVSLIVSGKGRHTTHLLKCVRLLSTSQTDWRQSSDVLSDMSFDILSDILCDILSDISSDTLSGISPDLLSGILSDISSDILSGISRDILSDISSITFCLTFFLTYLLTFFLTYLLTFYLVVEVRQGTLAAEGRSRGPAGNTGRTGSQLRSGREHWPQRVAVEVRQGTLGTAGCSWGSAGNTGRRGSREHWAQQVAVEVRKGTLAAEGRGWGPAGNTGRGGSRLRSDSAATKRRRKEEGRRKKEGGRRRKEGRRKLT